MQLKTPAGVVETGNSLLSIISIDKPPGTDEAAFYECLHGREQSATEFYDQVGWQDAPAGYPKELEGECATLYGAPKDEEWPSS